MGIQGDRDLRDFVADPQNFACNWQSIFPDVSTFAPIDGRELHTHNFSYGSVDDNLQDTFGLEGLIADGEITTISTPRMRVLSFPSVTSATLISIAQSEFLEELHLPNLKSIGELLVVREDGAPDLCLVDLSSLLPDSAACQQVRALAAAGQLCQRGTLRLLGCESGR